MCDTINNCPDQDRDHCTRCDACRVWDGEVCTTCGYEWGSGE